MNTDDFNAGDDSDDDSEEVQPRDVGHIVRFLWPFARPHRQALILLLIVLLVETVFNFCFPLAAQRLVDDGLIARDVDVVVGVLFFLAAAAVIVCFTGLTCDYLYTQTFSAMVVDIRQNLFGHLQGLSMPFFTRSRAGGILSRFSGDLVAVEGCLIALVPWFVLPLLEVVYSVVLMYLFSVRLALLGSLVFPLILFLPRLFAGRALTLSYEKRQREGALLSAVQENVAAQPVVKAFGLQPLARGRFHGLNAAWLQVAFRVNFFSALVERSANTGVYLVHLLIFGLGAYWTYNGEMSVGTLVAFESTFLSMGYALTYVTQFTPTLAQAAGSMRHLDELFAQKPQVVDAPRAGTLPRFEREIVFENVGFRYAEGGFAVECLDVRIPKGTFVAFVGASGSGKSTILNLLLRFYEPSHGAVLFDGRDLRTITQESLRAQVGMVFQESFLFNASLLDNIRMGRPEATMQEVMAAAQAAEIHDYISRLPRGYETLVGERGSQLSGGQRQRLAIARALVRDPALLVLDEATSALDYATEAALNETLAKIAEKRTVVMVTHRLGSVVAADTIFVLANGRVLEKGTHEELLEMDGSYASLWWKQGEKEAIREA